MAGISHAGEWVIMAKAPGILGSRALTTELRKLGAEVVTVSDDGTQLTREEVLADLIWKQALGWTEKIVERDKDGNRSERELRHNPVAWAQQYLFERMEGKAPQALVEEGTGIKASEKVRDLARQRINTLSKIASGPPLPKPPPKANP